MASLTIKNLPNELYEHLKYSATTHRRSINSELIVCLEQVLLPKTMDPTENINTAQALRAKVIGQLTANEISAAKQAGRT